MNKKALVNYIYTAAYQVLLVLLPIITTPYVSRVLGVENIGKDSYIATIVSYFVLFSQIGLNIYGRKEVACVQQDINKRSQLFFQLLVIRVCLSLMSCVAYYAFVAFNPILDQKLLLINGISIWANMLDITWYFQGLEKFKFLTIRNFLIRIFCTICIFIFVKSENDIYVFVAISCVSNFIAQLCLWPSLRHQLIHTKFRIEGIKKHFFNSWVMFVPTIFNTCYTKLDKIMLGALATEAESGIYAQGEKIINMLLGIITSMSVVFMPALANMIASNKDIKEIKKVLENNGKIVWAIGIPLVMGLSGISKVFTAVFLGAGYEKVEYVIYILAPITIMLGFSDLYGGQYLIASGHQKEFNVSIALGAVVNIIMNYFMIPKWYSVGAALATLITEFFIAVLQANVVRKHIQVSIKPPLYYIVAGSLIFASTKLIDLFGKKTVYVLIIQILIGIIIYFGVLYLKRDDFLIKVMNMLKGKLKNYTC